MVAVVRGEAGEDRVGVYFLLLDLNPSELHLVQFLDSQRWTGTPHLQ